MTDAPLHDAHVRLATKVVRDAGFTLAAFQFPRTRDDLAALCAFNGVPVEKAPHGWRYFPNAGLRDLWKARLAA